MSKIILASIIVFLPTLALAADFVPLVGIPGLTGSATDNFSDYINAVYRLSISIAALIAVVKIIGAGVKYMFSDIVTSKSAAIADIRSSLLGLLVVIGAVLILSTVNEDLTNFKITLTPTDVTAPPPPVLTPIEELCDGPDGCETLSCSSYSSWPGYVKPDPADSSCTAACIFNGGITTTTNTPKGSYVQCTLPKNLCAVSGGFLDYTGKCVYGDDYFTSLESSRCEVGYTCDARACDESRNGGILFVTCESQCVSGNYYDPISMGCMTSTPTPTDLVGSITVVVGQIYTMILDPDDEDDADDLAAGLDPTITITGTESVNGYVTVTDSEGNLRYVDCDDISPSICAP